MDQASSDNATIVASTDPLSAIYFEISLAVAAKACLVPSVACIQARGRIEGCFVNNLTSTTCTGHRASLRKPSLSGGIGVKVKDETWNTHQWLAKPRRLAVEPSNTVVQHHCVRCGRGLRHGSILKQQLCCAISFDQLSDQVTQRWLSEPCPGRHLSRDDEDRNKIIAALRVS